MVIIGINLYYRIIFWNDQLKINAAVLNLVEFFDIKLNQTWMVMSLIDVQTKNIEVQEDNLKADPINTN